MVELYCPPEQQDSEAPAEVLLFGHDPLTRNALADLLLQCQPAWKICHVADLTDAGALYSQRARLVLGAVTAGEDTGTVLQILWYLQEKAPCLPCVLLHDYGGPVLSALLPGVHMLNLSLSVSGLRSALRSLLQHGRSLSPLFDSVPCSVLTKRQKEILFLLASGLKIDEVSLLLGISRKTVYAHQGSILSRLALPGRYLRGVFQAPPSVTAVRHMPA